MKNALILCSGGLDSVTTAYYVRNKLKYEKIKILFFDYGQRNLRGEEKFSRECADSLKADFIKLRLNLGENTSLINTNKRAKKIKKKDLKNTKKESDKWYVPYRNSLFLINALALAESLFIKENRTYDISVGFKCDGNESYPDTTKEFVELMNKLGKLGKNKKSRIIAPLIDKDKEDIVLIANKLGFNLKNTLSCYVGPEKHCGICLACSLRKQGFYWANIKDPSSYEK